MSAEKIIRSQAREKLKHGGWSRVLIALAVIAMFYMIIECVATLEYIITDAFTLTETAEFVVKVSCGSLVVLTTFLLSPALLGFFRMLCNDNKEYDTNDVVYYFSSFERYTKALSFVLGFTLRMILPSILCFSLVIILILIKAFFLKDSLGDTEYQVMLVLFIITAFIFTLRYATRYFVSFYLLCEDEDKPVSYYFTVSKIVMRNREKDVVKLSNTFSGWIVLCITVLPLLYVLPYYTQAMCISAKWITQISRNG
ncbi:MAG: DUF975 family protein [Ruminococcus sp.]|nr:DUF975 family protein [Ruminococcus sp.]